MKIAICTSITDAACSLSCNLGILKAMNEVTYPAHPLLDRDSRNFMESMIVACDDIGADIKKYHSFLKYWLNRVQRKPSAQNAFLYAFKFFSSNENKGIELDKEKEANEYLKDLKFHLNDLGIVGESMRKFIESFQSDFPRSQIITEDIEWFPKPGKEQWTKPEYVVYANIFKFAWSIARLWHLFESRNAYTHINQLKNFFFVLSEKEPLIDCVCKEAQKVPNEMRNALKTLSPENIEFFDKYLFFFSPEYLTLNEMCMFWKKACISSIEGKTVQTALKKPLNNIWLLGRFFLVHPYTLNFFNGNRGFTDKAFKQIYNTSNPEAIKKIKQIRLDEIVEKKRKQKQLEWGDKKISIFEVCATICSDKEWEKIEKQCKENEIDEAYESNPSREFLEAAASYRSKNTLLNKFDFSNKHIKKWAAKEPKKFNTLIVVISVLELFKKCSKDDFSILEDLFKNFALMGYETNLIISQGVNHEKNLFLIAMNDIDAEFLKDLLNILVVVLLVIAIQELSNSWSNDKTDQSNSTT